MRKLKKCIVLISEFYCEVKGYNRMVGISEIARRYFANNAFDGVLTTIGVLIGNYLAGVRDVAVPIRIGLATSVAMGISGMWGAYLVETAERQRELTELEKITLTDQNDTKLGRASRFAVIIISLVDGLSPFLSSLIVLIPLFFNAMIGNTVISYALSIGVALLSLFGLGLFLGHTSQKNLFGYGVRAMVAGLVAIGINFLMEAG